MNLVFSLALLIHFSAHFHGHCTTDNLQLGAERKLVVPELYITGFIARAYVLETTQPVPTFRAGLTVEAIEEKYVCSFDVFLGDFKVWSSSHLSPFFTSEKCMIHLTWDGDLLLTGQGDMMGWRTATFGQGIKRLQLLNTGNLVLVGEFNMTKWQSFHFPTNVMLWGQRLDVGTKLTSFPTNSNSFYSLEIHREKLTLYFNSGKFKYSYWEFNPLDSQNVSFISLASNGLQVFNDDSHKIAQIPSKRLQLLRFLAIENTTGNLAFYYYTTNTTKFEASFQALKNNCDRPRFCEINEICTFSNKCSFLEIKGSTDNFCGNFSVDMKEIKGVTSVLRDENKITNTTKETCESSCIEDCACVGALFTSVNRECNLYGEIMGVKEVSYSEEVSFFVKVLKGGKKGSGLKKWELILIVIGDGIVLFICLGGIGYYLLWKKRKEANNN